ncbi:MAG: tetratricopeptide repeat protein [Cryomorphaceae bacterium]|nr:tetratricopeptide repeat protein [Flavobacteriales bacterium]
MKRLYILFTLLIFSAAPALSQGTSDEQLAAYYFESGEFEKARLYYEKLYDTNPGSANFTALFQSLTELKEYKDAEKLVKKHMKRFKSNIYYIDLGGLYELTGDDKEASKAYQEAIDNLPASQGMIIRTANEFIRRNKLELALETYKEGKKMLDGKYPFSYEIASLYGTMGDKERMISEYLDLISFNTAYLQTVQNALNRSMDLNEENDETDFLRKELLRRVQKDPGETTFAEMLTWLFLQKRDFNSAYVQLKAIDKRLNEDGQRVLNLATLSMNNGAYEVASKCYKYVAEKGRDNNYYVYARAGELRADFETSRRNYPVDTAELKGLRERYESAIAELGNQRESVNMFRQKAKLEGFYLNDMLAATITLNEVLDMPGLPSQTRAEIKLELAEILVARDYIWDASLLASQVDKAFKQDLIGFEAKLLNARISYYVGDFEWAQAQLDVLKGSTSKLISNDAMRLSLLITDNLNLDTILDPMIKFARADLMTLQNRFAEAEATLDSITSLYPYHSITDDVLMQKGKIAEAKGNIEGAIEYYGRVTSEHYFDIVADDALFRMAELYEEKLDDETNAGELYRTLITDFPGSLFVVEARKRLRRIRGDSPENIPSRIEKDKVP